MWFYLFHFYLFLHLITIFTKTVKLFFYISMYYHSVFFWFNGFTAYIIIQEVASRLINEYFDKSLSASLHSVLMHRRHQQYECKWYIPLADLAFQTLDDSDSHSIQVLPEHEIEEMKIKISALKSEIQKEKVPLVRVRRSMTAALSQYNTNKL